MKKYISSLLVFLIFLGSIPIGQVPVYAAEKENWHFGFTGSVEEWTAPYTGKYFIEAYGASSENATLKDSEGGGVSNGYINLVEGQKLYICVGEKGITNGPRTYNGGGAGGQGATAGSGATSITTTDRGELKNFDQYRQEVVLVAGGAGGQGSIEPTEHAGGGGGEKGAAYDQSLVYGKPWGHGPTPGSQTSGYAFGEGGDYSKAIVDSHNCGGFSGGGGGGWYGGSSGKCGYIQGGGGSGYLNRNYLYDCTTMTSGHKGHGAASITYDGDVETNFIIDLNKHGSYDGETDRIIVTKGYGEVTTFHDPEQTDDFVFAGWEVKYGTVDVNSGSYTHGWEDACIVAQWSARLSVTSEIDINAYNNKGGTSFTVTQLDAIEKYMTIRQSKDGITYYDVFQDEENRSPQANITRFDPAIPVSAYNFPVKTVPVGTVPGRVQTYSAKKDGLYKLEVFGSNAKYENDSINASTWKTYTDLTRWNDGGTGGGYARGYVGLSKDQTLYVAVGNHGYQHLGGWNGGGNGSPAMSNLNYGGQAKEWYYRIGAGGGGATHIATKLIGDGQLKNYENDKDSVLLCAGGAGGAAGTHGLPGSASGGGTVGGHGMLYTLKFGTVSYDALNGKLAGGSQSSGYQFGQGESVFGAYRAWKLGGAGGGWYGGYACDSATMYTTRTDHQVCSGGGGSGHIGNVISGHLESGLNEGDGYAIITLQQEYIGGNYISNIFTPDEAAPNKPSNGKIQAGENRLTVTFDKPEDNGTNYWHEITTYKKDAQNASGLTPMLCQEIVKNNVTTGIKGYYYAINTTANTTVSTSNSFITTESVEMPVAAYDRYLHIAAVDGAGNLSQTYHLKIDSVAKYVINHYVQNEDGTYTLVKTEEKMGQIGSTVTPDIIPQTGRDNPPAKSIVITADGKAHVDYYYDVTRFDATGTVSWNDHENLYGTRPDSIGITIYRDGEYFDYLTIPVPDTVNKYRFPQMQKYDLETGREFVYTVKQDVAYSQAALEHSEDKYTTIQDGFDFLNGIRNTERPTKPGYPDEPVDPDNKGLHVEGEIHWDDNEDSLGFRPSEVTITIYQKGEDGEWKPFGEPIIVDSKNENHYLFDWLPKYWYDENDVPTAYEYKVEESFEAWYVKDGEIKDAYVIHADQPNDFDFTNELIPDGPIIPVTEHVNTIIVKTNTDEPVRIILKPLEVFIHDDYSVSYGDLTGNDVPVVADKTGTSASGLTGTRYEIVLDSPDYTLEDITLSIAENMELEKIGDKWYVTIKNVPEDVIGTLDLTLSPKEHFYQDKQRFMNYFAVSPQIMARRLPEYFSIRMSDSVVISDIEEDSSNVDKFVIVYMESDTEDPNTYSAGDKAMVLDYLGMIPAGSEFIGWAGIPDSGEADYLVGDEIELENSIELYPVFTAIENINLIS